MAFLWPWHLFFYHFILFFHCYFFLHGGLGMLIFLSLPLSGLFAWDYYLLFKRIKGGFKAWNLIF